MPRHPIIALGCSALLSGCVAVSQLPDERVATVVLMRENGLPAGTAMLNAANDKLRFSIAGAGLPPGAHGLHLHATGKCDAPGFTTAGPHLNPGARQHGTDNPAGSHLGDLPNLVADAKGAGAVSLVLPGSAAEIKAQLFDADGTALVIHASADDYRTDPTGNSGARIACGVLIRS